MVNRKLLVMVILGTMICLVSFDAVIAETVENPKQVEIVNAEPVPVSVEGLSNVQITNIPTVQARQSGVWEISPTPVASSLYLRADGLCVYPGCTSFIDCHTGDIYYEESAAICPIPPIAASLLTVSMENDEALVQFRYEGNPVIGLGHGGKEWPLNTIIPLNRPVLIDEVLFQCMNEEEECEAKFSIVGDYY